MQSSKSVMDLELPSSTANVWVLHLQKSQVTKMPHVFPQETLVEYFSCSANVNNPVCLFRIFVFSPMNVFSVSSLLIITGS